MLQIQILRELKIFACYLSITQYQTHMCWCNELNQVRWLDIDVHTNKQTQFYQ